MKKVWGVMMLAVVLAGCSPQPTFETVDDSPVYAQPSPREIRVDLPADTVLPVMETESGQLYICRDYEVVVQTLPGGDLSATVFSLCGFDQSQLEILETSAGGFPCYDFAWSCAAELGEQVGRARIISDGAYHYCLSAMTAEKYAQEYREVWNGMFETFRLG